MKAKQYRIRQGAHLKAQYLPVVVKTVEQLVAEDRLSPTNFLEAARPETAPLHDLFEWDDTQAANEYRLEQARRILRSIEVVVVGADKKEHATRYVHALEGEHEGEASFVVHDQVKRSPTLAQRLADDAYESAVNWADRYQEFCEVYPVVNRRVGGIVRAVRKAQTKAS